MLELDVKLSLDRFDLAAALAVDSPVTACFGPPGSGKSTLLGMIAGTVNPQRGWIKLEGETLFDSGRGIRVPPRRRRVGLVTPDPTVYPRYPVKTHLQVAYGQAPFRSDGIRLRDVVELMELDKVLDCHSHQLSPGEKQRVALAHALMSSPRLLLLDDHSQVRDGMGVSRILPFLKRVRDDLGVAVMYVSPTLGGVLQLTDQMVLMANGRVLGVGDVHEIIADRILLAGSALQGVDNVLPVTILGHEADTACTTAYYYGAELVLPIAPHLPLNESALVSVSSSAIALSKNYLDGISIQNQIKGRIGAIICAPDHVVVQIDCGTTLLAGVSLRALKQMDLREGDNVYCLIKAHAFVHVAESPSPPARRAVSPPATSAGTGTVALPGGDERERAAVPALEKPFSPTRH